MTKYRLLPALGLLAVFLAACSSATAGVVPTQPALAAGTATVPPPVPTLDTSAQITASPTGALVPTPLPVVTSRGPNLEATDPTTVKMASGGLQFVEFVEFW